MQANISFLRAVNITGHNSIKMTDLAALYTALGFIGSETYIQSGNVVFNCDRNITAGDISDKIEKAILEKFNYVVPVMIRTLDEMRSLISINPFLTEERFDPARVAVIFLHEAPSETQIQKVINVSYPPDKFKIIGSEIFTFCPDGFGKTKLYTNFFESKMGVTGTARNWKSVTTLISMAEKMQSF